MPLVGVAELARLLKRDPKAIPFAVSRGRITRRPDGLFDADQAIAEWNANTLHERSHSANKELEVTPVNDLPLENQRPSKVSNYSRARAAVQIYEARLKKLRYEEKAKTLVLARDVEDAAFRTVSCLREACMNIPARLAAQLAIETDQTRCYALLEAENHRHLYRLCGGPDRMNGGAALDSGGTSCICESQGHSRDGNS